MTMIEDNCFLKKKGGFRKSDLSGLARSTFSPVAASQQQKGKRRCTEDEEVLRLPGKSAGHQEARPGVGASVRSGFPKTRGVETQGMIEDSCFKGETPFKKRKISLGYHAGERRDDPAPVPVPASGQVTPAPFQRSSLGNRSSGSFASSKDNSASFEETGLPPGSKILSASPSLPYSDLDLFLAQLEFRFDPEIEKLLVNDMIRRSLDDFLEGKTGKRFYLLLGGSGTGKSTFVRANLERREMYYVDIDRHIATLDTFQCHSWERTEYGKADDGKGEHQGSRLLAHLDNFFHGGLRRHSPSKGRSFPYKGPPLILFDHAQAVDDLEKQVKPVVETLLQNNCKVILIAQDLRSAFVRSAFHSGSSIIQNLYPRTMEEVNKIAFRLSPLFERLSASQRQQLLHKANGDIRQLRFFFNNNGGKTLTTLVKSLSLGQRDSLLDMMPLFHFLLSKNGFTYHDKNLRSRSEQILLLADSFHGIPSYRSLLSLTHEPRLLGANAWIVYDLLSWLDASFPFYGIDHEEYPTFFATVTVLQMLTLKGKPDNSKLRYKEVKFPDTTLCSNLMMPNRFSVKKQDMVSSSSSLFTPRRFMTISMKRAEEASKQKKMVGNPALQKLCMLGKQ